jgi:beta-xylosidase
MRPGCFPDAVPLIRRDLAWEDLVIEAPTLVKHAGRYYLFYSGGFYGSDAYAMGYASAPALLGPYRKADAPILSMAGSGLPGPGGQDIFTGPDGASWIAFHAWRRSGSQPFRALYFGRIAWDPAGPVVRTTCALTEPPF